MKHLINILAQPKYLFTICTVLFFVAIKYYRIVGTKKFGKAFGLISVLLYAWAGTDPNFHAIIFFPDNVPITILLVTVGFFTWYTIYKCAENDKRIEAGLQPLEGTPENREKVWSWPNLVYTELFAIIAGTVFLIVWAIIFKAPLEEPANPTWAPNPAKAPWYFLGLQEMLVYFDPWMAGVVLPVLIIVGLVAIPYIDTNPKGNGYFTFSERKWAVVGFCYGWLVLWVFLIVVGTFLRGPNWTFYGPFEFWDFHKVVAENNINLSEIFWIKTLNTAMPKNMFVREILGLLGTIGYLFFTLPLIKAVSPKAKKALDKMKVDTGLIRYYLFIFLILMTASLPIKMYLRWLFNLKYIIALPELELSL